MDDMAAHRISANPMHGPNKLKLGVFNINCNGGLTISLAPERWKADWPEVVKATIMADEAGHDFILPVAKWHGYGGKSNNLHRSYETLTHGAALGALTKHAAMFCTVHVPLVTPAFTAKAMATIDHVSGGRFGLNIVVGNAVENAMFGAPDIPHEDYYGYAWCFPGLFTHAYHSQSRCDGPGNFGRTSVNRFHVLDRIPFTQDIQRIAVGDSEILSAELITSREVLVLGRETGRTTVIVWFANGASREFRFAVQRDLYQGIFFDRMRFPSPAEDPERQFVCFCKYCQRIASDSGLGYVLLSASGEMTSPAFAGS